MTRKKTDLHELSRRHLLRGVGAGALAGVGLGCAADGDGGPGDLYGDGKYDEFGDPAECEGGPNLGVQELMAPVDHIVVLMMENRSFDHYFGSLSLVEGFDDVDGLKGDETNPGPDGNPVPIHRLDPAQKLHHLPHKWDPMHSAFNDSKMDGFVMAHHEHNKEQSTTAGPEVMGFLQREDIPIMYALADNYTLCDRWFCSVMGPTWPNRFYIHAASAGGRHTNRPKWFMDTIWGALKDRDLKGINYFGDIPWAAAALGKLTGFRSLKRFFKDAAAGTLPDYSLIDPGFFSSTSDHPREVGGDSDHPEMGPNVGLGQLLIGTIYQALANSPAWERTLFVITYDESGGFYDHVAPPKTVDDRDEFRQLGFRVPSIVIGPHVRSRCINFNTFDHTSVISTATRKWGLEPLNDRVIATNDLSSCINPERLDDPAPPIQLPQVQINEDELIEKLEHNNTQPEMMRMADAGDIPAELDLRSELVPTTKLIIDKARQFGLLAPRFKSR